MNDRQNGPILRTAFNTIGPNATAVAGAALCLGCVPGSRMAYSANPANNDVFQIGSATFKFVTSLAAQTTFTQIKVLGTAALSLAAALNAINGVADANVVQGTTYPTQFAAAPFLVADAVTATSLRIRNATKMGGNPLAGVSPSTALTCSITAGAAAWSEANLNANGKVGTDVQQAVGSHTVTAAEVTAASFDIELEFQPTLYDIYAASSTGLLKAITELITIPANQKCLHITLGTGGTPLASTDVVQWWAGA